MTPDFDPYAELGIPNTASAADVRKAYYRQAKTYHPDRPGGDAERFKRINTAHSILSDDERRANWDEFGAVSLSLNFDPTIERQRRATPWAYAESTPRQPTRSAPQEPVETHDVRIRDDRPWWSGVRVDHGSFGAFGAWGPKGPGDL